MNVDTIWIMIVSQRERRRFYRVTKSEKSFENTKNTNTNKNNTKNSMALVVRKIDADEEEDDKGRAYIW